VSAVAVHHVVAGPPDAPAVLLSNSLGTSLRMWEPQMAALVEHFQVVRYDLRGHGQSPASEGPYTLDDLTADALALLDRLDIERAHLVGLSLGGMVSMQLAATAPERVGRVVLCCTSAYLQPAQSWHTRAATVRADGIGAVAEAVLGRWLTPAFAAASPSLVRDLRAMLESTPAEGYAGCCEAIAAMDLRPCLRHIQAPALIVVGADDPAIPAAHADTIAAELKDARTVTVGPAAHLANVEQPIAVGQHILSHLTEGERP
jgi:3-oxoadipate enol-lactonase